MLKWRDKKTYLRIILNIPILSGVLLKSLRVYWAGVSVAQSESGVCILNRQT